MKLEDVDPIHQAIQMEETLTQLMEADSLAKLQLLFLSI